ncbi:MAG TPA: AMP-binding protein, partial [Rhodanobacteraceae bacterium]|nr:AMP-binding protein [Rhodanobacteraceae bacterium]
MSKLHPVPSGFAAAEQTPPAAYAQRYAESLRDPEAFWTEAAKRLDWIKPPTEIKDVSYDPSNLHIRWYADGVLNPTVSCLDRHLATRGDKTALLFEGDDPGVSRTLSYRELHAEVCRFANALRNLGVGKGDRVAIYMPMIPEACVAMLACARIGAIHSVVFGGFSPDALAGR